MKIHPKISIITPSYLQSEFLEETINSVLDQGYPDLEYIIIDGGSADGSVEIIKKYEKHLSYCVSEPDNGQSDAINKILKRSNGAVFNWLNSDDLLVSGALEKVGKAFSVDPDLVCFGGQIHCFDSNGSKLFDSLNDVYDHIQLYCDPVINQMATFYNGNVIRELGVNTALHYAMDYGLWLNVLFAKGPEKMLFVPQHLADFRLHGAQKTREGFGPFVNDIANILADISQKAGANELSSVVLLGHQPIEGFEGDISINSDHKDLIQEMVVFFLLKWHYKIYTSTEFRMMKRFVKWVENEDIKIHEEQRDRYRKLCEEVNVPNWLTYRIRRKIIHSG